MGQAEKYKPLFVQGVIRVRHIQGQRIAKNRGCFFKRNSMFTHVGCRLPRIPVKIITHELPPAKGYSPLPSPVNSSFRGTCAVRPEELKKFNLVSKVLLPAGSESGDTRSFLIFQGLDPGR